MARIFNSVFISMAGAAALSIIAIASCSRSKEQVKEQPSVAAAQLPALSARAELDTAVAKAGDRMLVLDFYADWCRPCRMFAPTIDKIAEEYKDKAHFYRVNVDQSPELFRAFGVQGIPYIVFMKKGKAVYALTGINPEEYYTKVLTICDGLGSPEECTRQLNDKM
jgi:thioredoxin 1